MEMTLKAAETAHRNLLQRIERLLAEIERAGRAPVDRESLCLQRAIGSLRAKAYLKGEDEMLCAERPELIAYSVVFAADVKVPTLVELRALLRQAVEVE